VAEELASDGIGVTGMRLTRDEAMDLVHRAVTQATTGGAIARASDVRRAARDILGRDSESLSERNFTRILKDAHDADRVDLRRRGDDFEVTLATAAAPIAEQLGAAEQANAPAPREAAPATPRGMGPRGAGSRMRPGAKTAPPPLDLLSVGVVDIDEPVAAASVTPPAATPAAAPAAAPAPAATAPAQPAPEAAPAPARGRKSGAKKAPAKAAANSGAKTAANSGAKTAAKGGAKTAAKTARRKTAKKS
jgi:hypothetical protein